jgi:hypothetical protein
VTQPTAFGRKIPRNDFEGDDETPGAGGHFVTCTDSALSRMVAWATNGRIDKDGKVYRAAVGGSSGINLQTAAVAAQKVAGVTLFVPTPGEWDWGRVSSYLMAGNGLIAQGWYDRLPRALRFQDNADFGHAMFFCYRSKASGVRNFDPLNPDTTRHGVWIPAANARAFLEDRDGSHPEFHYRLGFVPMQPL